MSELEIPSSSQLARVAPIADAREAEEARALSTDPWERTEAWRERWILGLPNDATRLRYREGFLSLETYARMSGKAIMEMNRRDIEVWAEVLAKVGNPAAERPKPLAEATRVRHMSTASSFFRYCMEFEESGINRNPVPGKSGRPVVSKYSNQRVLRPEQVRAILRTADADGPHSAAFMALLLCCLRVTEACTAQVGALSETNGHRVLTVRRKGGKIQDIPTPPAAWDRCKKAIDERSSGPIVAIREQGTWHGLTRVALGSRIGTLARRAGVKTRVTPHTFRHIAITTALRKHPLHVVQAWAGHENPATTERYWHEAQNLDQSPAYDVIGGFYADLYETD
jgi:integrase/recombinase XerD